MRKVVVSVVSAALFVGLSACASPGPHTQAGEADGVTAATIKRAAVLGDHVDFGGDVNSVENYDLQTQQASIANPIDSSDSAREDEIDSIVNKISNDKNAPSPDQTQSKPNGSRPSPAVPPLSQQSDASTGLTGSIAPVRAPSPLPPLPEVVSNPASGEDAQMATDQARLFPKPLWRRALEKKSQTVTTENAPESGD